MPSLPPVLVELKADATKFMSSMKSAQTEIEKTATVTQSAADRMANVGKVAFAGLGVAAVGFAGVAVKAALEGEAAHAQLVQAVQNSGTVFSAVGGKVDEMSDRFAKLGYENDAVEAALARLVQSTGNVSKSMQEMGLVADFARARHIDLEQAATVVGKVMNGNVTALQKLGISAKDSAGNTLSAAQALQMLSERFGGAAQAQAGTYAGKLQAMNAEWKNMVENVGNMLLPVLANAAGHVADVVGWFDKHRVAAEVLAGIIGGPLVIAMNAYIAKQAVAFVGSTIETVKKLGAAIMTVLVPATEAEAAALTTAAVAESILTAGLSAAAGIAAIAGIAALNHATSTKQAGTAAGSAAGQMEALAAAETDLGPATDQANAHLKKQSDLFEELNGDAEAQQSEILKLISDQQGLDRATKTLTGSTGRQAEADKEAKTATENLTKAKDKLAKAQDEFNKLQAGVGLKIARNEEEAHHNLEQAQLSHEEAQQKVTEAVAEYGQNSNEARQASLDLESATFSLTDAQAAMGHVGEDAWKEVDAAQQKVVDAKDDVQGAIDAQTEALKKQKQPAADLAANTLAWQQAQNSLNGDWKTFEAVVAAHPELRTQLIGQLKSMRDSLPKGSDLKPFNDMIDRLNNMKIEKLNTLLTGLAGIEAVVKQDVGNILNNIQAPSNSTNPGGLTGGSADYGGGTFEFAGGAAEGAVVRATRGGKLMLVGEGGQDEAIIPLPSGLAALGNPAAGMSVVININGYQGDKRELAEEVQAILLRYGRNNASVGLG